MYQYSIIQWIFIFYFYCFFGWCFESTYVSLKSKKWVNRGFMRGPFLPLYGSGAIMMLLVSRPFTDNLVLVYVAGCVGATALEYVTGVTMEALFKVRYWDYSYKKFHFQGHICLSSTLAWGGLTILMTRFLHKPVERFVFFITGDVLTVVTFLLTAVIFADFALSFKAAMDLREVLIKLEQAKEEIAHLQKRMDVVIALTGEEFSERKEEFTAALAEKREELTEELAVRREALRDKMIDLREDLAENAGELKAEYEQLLMAKKKDWEHKINAMSGQVEQKFHSILRGNPSMSSKHFKESMEQLKKRVLNKS